MYIIIALLIGLVIGFIRKGSVKSIFTHPYNKWWMGLIGVAGEIVLHAYCYTTGFEAYEQYLPILNFVCYLLLLVMMIFNLDDIYTIVIAIGLTLNFVVTFINGGYLPVSEEVLSGMPLYSQMTQSIYTGTNGVYTVMQSTQTLLWFLGVIIPIPVMVSVVILTGTVAGVSVGDIFILLGLIGLVQRTMTLGQRQSKGTIVDNSQKYPIYEDRDTSRFDSKTEELFFEDQPLPKDPLDRIFREDDLEASPTQVLRPLSPETVRKRGKAKAYEVSAEETQVLKDLQDLTRPIGWDLAQMERLGVQPAGGGEMSASVDVKPVIAPENEGNGFFASQFLAAENRKEVPGERIDTRTEPQEEVFVDERRLEEFLNKTRSQAAQQGPAQTGTGADSPTPVVSENAMGGGSGEPDAYTVGGKEGRPKPAGHAEHGGEAQRTPAAETVRTQSGGSGAVVEADSGGGLHEAASAGETPPETMEPTEEATALETNGTIQEWSITADSDMAARPDDLEDNQDIAQAMKEWEDVEVPKEAGKWTITEERKVFDEDESPESSENWEFSPVEEDWSEVVSESYLPADGGENATEGVASPVPVLDRVEGTAALEKDEEETTEVLDEESALGLIESLPEKIDVERLDEIPELAVKQEGTPETPEPIPPSSSAKKELNNMERSEKEMMDIWSQVAEENRKMKLGRRQEASANYQTDNPYREEAERKQAELRARKEAEQKAEDERRKAEAIENRNHQDETAEAVNAHTHSDLESMSEEERVAAGYEKVAFEVSGKRISFWRKKNN